MKGNAVMMREGVRSQNTEVWDIVPNCRPPPPLPYMGHEIFLT